MMSTPQAADLLATIVAAAQRIVEVRVEREPMAALERRAELNRRPSGLFLGSLQAGPISVIAECKGRSPSKGVLRAHYDPVAIALGYVEAGAAAISVLTEPTFFNGALEHLVAVRAVVDAPLLRKDFVVSEYQVVEAKAAGADAILLIVAALNPSSLRALMARAAGLGLDVLVEVHELRELDVALDAGARLIGVNNRNLRTLEVDVRASEALIARMPADVVAVSESGLRTPADLVRLRGLGYRAFLIGERLMTAADPGLELRRVLDGVRREGGAKAS